MNDIITKNFSRSEFACAEQYARENFESVMAQVEIEAHEKLRREDTRNTT